MPIMEQGCHGNGADHCCYWPDPVTREQLVCPFLEQNTVPGRRWACGKRRILGSWSAVHADPEYINVVGNLWQNANEIWQALWMVGLRCGSWPDSMPTQGDINKLPQPQRDIVNAYKQKALTVYGTVKNNPGVVVDLAFCDFGGRQPV